MFEWFDISETFCRLMVEINGFCPIYLLKLFVDNIINLMINLVKGT